MNAGYLLRRGPKGGHPINNLDDLRRVALIGVVLATVIGVPSSVAFFAAYRWDLGAAVFGDPSAIIDGGPAAAAFLRWGAIGDMLFSYLLLVPLALYLHARLRPRKPWLADIGTIGALAYIFVGASGAAILAAVGPPTHRSICDGGAHRPPRDRDLIRAAAEPRFLWSVADTRPDIARNLVIQRRLADPA